MSIYICSFCVVCLDLTPHLLLTIKETYTLTLTQTRTHMQLSSPKDAMLPDLSQHPLPPLPVFPPTSSSILHLLPNLSSSCLSHQPSAFVIPTSITPHSSPPPPRFKLSPLFLISIFLPFLCLLPFCPSHLN